MPLPELTRAALEGAINRYLALDPQVASRLGTLHGKVIAVELSGLESTLYLLPSDQRLLLLGHYEGEPDCTIRGTPLALARLARRREPAAFRSGEVEISGDSDLAHRVGKIFAAIEIDWEEQLSHLSGDLLAHRIGTLWRDLSTWNRRTRSNLQFDLQEYLHYEARLLPTRPEVEDFLEAVDRLRDDSERLAARLRRVQRQRTPEPKP